MVSTMSANLASLLYYHAPQKSACAHATHESPLFCAHLKGHHLARATSPSRARAQRSRHKRNYRSISRLYGSDEKGHSKVI